MDFTCNKDDLNHAVQTVQKAVSSKPNLPILAGIYLSARNNKLELQATDFEIGISCIIDADIETPGQTVLSGRYLQELVKRLPGEKIHFSANKEEKTIKIISHSAEFNLLMLPAEEFPVLNPMNNNNNATDDISGRFFSIKDDIFRDLIKKTIFSCGVEESRPIFTGALLEKHSSEICMAGTNTHRLALRRYIMSEQVENTIPQENPVRLVIPAKILGEIARQLNTELPKDISIHWEKNQICFSFDQVYIISRLIEGNFPDYNRVIPTSFETTALIKKDDFMDAVERSSLMAKDGEYNVIKFSFDQSMITVTSNNPDVGKAYETVSCQMQGAPITIAFNAKYVSDILKNIESENLIFSLNTPISAACIRPDGDDLYTYVITPVRVN